MLPAKNRLNLAARKNVPKALSEKIISENFVLTFQKTEEDFKAAVVVPKKAAKKAVDRNRIRRIIQEAVKELGFKKGNVIIFVRKNMAELKKDETKKLLEDIINKNLNDSKIR